MDTSPDRLRYLVKRFAEKNCSEQELQELDLLLRDDWNRIQLGQLVPNVDWENMYREITASPVIHLSKSRRKKIWYRIAAAASVILIAGTGIYFLFFNKKTADHGQQYVISQNHDVPAPKVARATLKLDDGRIVYLDSLGTGQLAVQGNVHVLKLTDGQIAYQPAVGGGKQPLAYNTLSNPRGSKVQSLTLVDGTQVWLNAASSITYPTIFAGQDRKVSITGEAYFEVVHDAARPFIVSKGTMNVEVLGTHFNVNAYDDETDIKVTLLEGSVRVRTETGSRKTDLVIKPGEQVRLTNNKVIVNRFPDLEEVMAWKNGKFQFGDAAGVEEIMRQISRWYDVYVEYKGTMTGHIGGAISRNVNASQVFRMLEMTGTMKFEIEGKKVTVSQ